MYLLNIISQLLFSTKFILILDSMYTRTEKYLKLAF